MHQVECGLEQWKNARAIELLDRHHAQRLLESAGRSYGSLPLAPERSVGIRVHFCRKVIEEMSDNGRILPIQLAMIVKKGQTPALASGHVESSRRCAGHSYRVLPDLFESSAAPQVYQRVCAAVVEVLYCLLPSEDRTSRNHYVSFAKLEQALAEKNLTNQLHRALHILIEDLRIVWCDFHVVVITIQAMKARTRNRPNRSTPINFIWYTSSYGSDCELGGSSS